MLLLEEELVDVFGQHQKGVHLGSVGNISFWQYVIGSKSQEDG